MQQILLSDLMYEHFDERKCFLTCLLFMVHVRLAAGIDLAEKQVILAHSPSLIFGLYPFIDGNSCGNTVQTHESKE